jgi:hypothetical protein
MWPAFTGYRRVKRDLEEMNIKGVGCIHLA